MNPVPLDLFESHRKEFEIYADLLTRWNQKINLTAITDPKEIKEFHFLDSLALAPAVTTKNVSRETLGTSKNFPLAALPSVVAPRRTTTYACVATPSGALPLGLFGDPISVLDMGSGNGLPGIALKIACPELQITLIDSIKKKCDFMKMVIRTLGLKNIEVQHTTLYKDKGIGQFDLVISRATFKLRDLLQFASPNLKAGGRIFAMKSFEIEKELNEAEDIINKLRLSGPEEFVYELPWSHQKRKILIFEKCFT